MVLLFPLTFIIWIVLLPFDKKRVVTHWILIYQSLVLSWLMPIWKTDIQGRKKFKKGSTYVVISNHQSMLDIILINCLMYNYKWISKVENTKVPFLGWYIRMADYITVDRGNDVSKELMLDKSLNYLRDGMSIMIFPEGTRSLTKEPGFFKRGAFQLAIQARVPILPVLIDGTGDILPKHGLVFGSHLVKIRVLDPLIPETFDNETPESLALKVESLIKSELTKLRSSVN